tara:strand:+ start:513 stop:710 length:198 start_codon:yes stop_codon:yes gene_type:complete
MVVKFNGKDVYFNGEINDIFDTHGPYDMEVEAIGEDNDGVEYSAIGTYDGEDIIDIEEDTIEILN